MGDEPSQRSIRNAAAGCAGLLSECLARTQDASAEKTQGEDLRASFNLWAAYVGVFATPKACLDARLTGHDDIKLMVLELLDMILLNLKLELQRFNAQLSGSSDSAQHQDDAFTKEHDDLWKTLGFGAVKSALEQLHSLATAIRHSSSRKDKASFQSASTDTTQGEWQGYRKAVERRFPFAASGLLDHLATSILARGKAMYYLQQHNQRLAANTEQGTSLKRADRIETEGNDSDDKEQQNQMPSILSLPHRPNTSSILTSDTSPSLLSKELFLKNLNRHKPSLSTISSNSTAVKTDNTDEYPPIPRVAAGGYVVCPLCSEPLAAVELTKKSWRSHIDRDMEPYVCVSSDCRDSILFFSHFRDWKQHMHTRHTMDWAQNIYTEKWYCNTGHEVDIIFEDRESFRAHLTTEHGSQISKSQLLGRLRRNRILAPREPFACPLCNCVPEDLSDKIPERPYDLLWIHIAQHLSSIAFISLSYVDIEFDAGSEASISHEQHSSIEADATAISEEEFTLAPHPANPLSELYTNIPPPDTADNDWNWIPARAYPERDLTLADFAASGWAKQRSNFGSIYWRRWGILHGPGFSQTNLYIRKARPGFLIGRNMECDIRVDEPTVSNRHCLIYMKRKHGHQTAVLADISSNGTFVNEANVGCNKQRELQNGDKITVGDTVFTFEQSNPTDYPFPYIDGYETDKMIGSGHVYNVFSCRKRDTGEVLAVKRLDCIDDRKWAQREEVFAEVAATMSFDHPNLPRGQDLFEESRVFYFVEEYCPGGELFDYIVKHKKLSEDKCRQIFYQLFRAVQYLHERYVVHRDIKAENIMGMDENFTTVKLVDLSLAQVITPESYSTSLMGTPSYVAPEILADSPHRKYNISVDIWSLGVVLYICLCGFPPFSDELYNKDSFPYTLSDQIKQGRFDYPSPYWDAVSDLALELIDWMLTVDPEKRYTIDQCLAHPWLRTSSLDDENKLDEENEVLGKGKIPVRMPGSPVPLKREKTLLAIGHDNPRDEVTEKYVDPTTELESLVPLTREQEKKPKKTARVVGLGGVGKTQMDTGSDRFGGKPPS